MRIEFLGGEILYSMRVVSHGAFNLCPSEVCNPEGGGTGHCEVPASTPLKPVEFYPYPEIPAEAVQTGDQSLATKIRAVRSLPDTRYPASGGLDLHSLSKDPSSRAAEWAVSVRRVGRLVQGLSEAV